MEPTVGVESLNLLTRPGTDVRASVQHVAELGVGMFRTLTCLARPEGISRIIHPIRNYQHWRKIRDDFLRTCTSYDVSPVLCLTDTPDRWKKAGLNDRTAQTWLGMPVTEDTAYGLGRFYLHNEVAAEDHPGLLVEPSNEPGDFDGYWAPDEKLAPWLQERGFAVMRGTRRGEDRGYSDCTVVSEHAWGPPGTDWPDRQFDRCEAIRAANPGKHVVFSTDGFAVEEYLDEAAMREVARWCKVKGFTFSALTRETPDRWSPRISRLFEAAVEGMAT